MSLSIFRIHFLYDLMSKVRMNEDEQLRNLSYVQTKDLAFSCTKRFECAGKQFFINLVIKYCFGCWVNMDSFNLTFS